MQKDKKQEKTIKEATYRRVLRAIDDNVSPGMETMRDHWIPYKNYDRKEKGISYAPGGEE